MELKSRSGSVAFELNCIEQNSSRVGKFCYGTKSARLLKWNFSSVLDSVLAEQGCQLGLTILKVFSNLNDSVLLSTGEGEA